MKRLLSWTGLLAAAVAIAAVGAATAGTEVPFKATDNGSATVVGMVGSVIETSDTGTGEATHIGLYTMVAGEHVDLATGAITGGFFTRRLRPDHGRHRPFRRRHGVPGLAWGPRPGCADVLRRHNRDDLLGRLDRRLTASSGAGSPLRSTFARGSPARLVLRDGVCVLVRATRCYHQSMREGANERERCRHVECETPAQRRRQGSRCEDAQHRGRLDKLGVTGSSPVPPTLGGVVRTAAGIL